jgi:hypothetical protein
MSNSSSNAQTMDLNATASGVADPFWLDLPAGTRPTSWFLACFLRAISGTPTLQLSASQLCGDSWQLIGTLAAQTVVGGVALLVPGSAAPLGGSNLVRFGWTLAGGGAEFVGVVSPR